MINILFTRKYALVSDSKDDYVLIDLSTLEYVGNITTDDPSWTKVQLPDAAGYNGLLDRTSAGDFKHLSNEDGEFIERILRSSKVDTLDEYLELTSPEDVPFICVCLEYDDYEWLGPPVPYDNDEMIKKIMVAFIDIGGFNPYQLKIISHRVKCSVKTLREALDKFTQE